MPFICMRHDFRAPAFGPASTAEIYAAAIDQYEWADKQGFDLLGSPSITASTTAGSPRR